MMRFIRSLFIFSILLILARSSVAAHNNHFIVMNDIHLDTTSTHLMEISPSTQSSDNDLDVTTFNKLTNKLSEQIKSQSTAPDFIIVLGDIVGHHRTSTLAAEQNEATVFSSLKNTFAGTPIFYVFGNNDSLKNNYGPFRDQDRESAQSPYDVATSNGWSNGFLSTGTVCGEKIYPCLLSENKNDGYYTAYLKPNLRLIALNSVMFAPRHTGTTQQDALNQLQWLETQLSDARDHHETVLLAMHIAPGTNVYNHTPFWSSESAAQFKTLLTDYQSIIIGILAAHTHAEELKVVQSADHQHTIGIYLTGALSTIHGNEPCVKTFYLTNDNNQWSLANYETFHFLMVNGQLQFEKLYDFKNYYCAQTLMLGYASLTQPTVADCLNQVTAEKMKKYFSGGNPNYDGVMQSPVDVFLAI